MRKKQQICTCQGAHSQACRSRRYRARGSKDATRAERWARWIAEPENLKAHRAKSAARARELRDTKRKATV